MKHKDIVIIEDNEWKNLSVKELREKAIHFYKLNISGKKTQNIDKGISVIFNNSGLTHVLYARKIGYEKAVILKKIIEIITQGSFSKWGNPKQTDKNKSIIGFMRFYCFVKINGLKKRVGFDIKIDVHGKFYYDHNIVIKKE